MKRFIIDALTFLLTFFLFTTIFSGFDTIWEAMLAGVFSAFVNLGIHFIVDRWFYKK